MRRRPKGLARRRIPAEPLLFRRLHASSPLVQQDVCDFTQVILEELDLSRNCCREEPSFRLGVNRDFALAGTLSHELTGLKGHDQIKTRLKLEGSHVLGKTLASCLARDLRIVPPRRKDLHVWVWLGAVKIAKGESSAGR
jgi:hypothetical protein